MGNHGKHIWYELITPDQDAASRYYSDAIGWQIDEGKGDPSFDYRFIHAADQVVGGTLGITAAMAEGGAKPRWLSYICVDDVDATVAKLTSLGGGVYMPAYDMAGVGRIAMVTDPDGVPFYVMLPESQDGESQAFHPDAVGHCGWNELMAGDLDTSFAFYEALFGWKKGRVMPMGEMGDYQMLTHDGIEMGAIMRNPEGRAPPRWNYYFRVADIDAAAAALARDGGQVIFGPQEVPGGQFTVNAIDPQGAMVSAVGASIEAVA